GDGGGEGGWHGIRRGFSVKKGRLLWIINMLGITNGLWKKVIVSQNRNHFGIIVLIRDLLGIRWDFDKGCSIYSRSHCVTVRNRSIGKIAVIVQCCGIHSIGRGWQAAV